MAMYGRPMVGNALRKQRRLDLARGPSSRTIGFDAHVRRRDRNGQRRAGRPPFNLRSLHGGKPPTPEHLA